MCIRSASSPSTVLWAFDTIQPSSLVLAFCIFFCFSLNYFILTLSAFVVLLSSVLCQETGREERLQNDLFTMQWDLKTLTRSINQSQSLMTAKKAHAQKSTLLPSSLLLKPTVACSPRRTALKRCRCRQCDWLSGSLGRY